MNHTLPEEVEAYRDRMWRREPEMRVEDAVEAERLIETVGFCAAMTDVRRPGPSLYVAVCGRRDAHMPRNVQKDPEASLTWRIKDDLMRRGRVYYAKLSKGRSTFVAPRLIPYFNALWGIPRRRESELLSAEARSVLKVLRREWEMATCDLREAARVNERTRLTRILDELQRTMKVVPGDVLYEPWFTYIWTLAEGRFSEELSVKVGREAALREVARAFLDGAGMTVLGELAKVTGLSRTDAGLGSHALVNEGYAERLATGVYRLSDFEKRIERLSVVSGP
jgi:Winged helix DNA-binding domain